MDCYSKIQLTTSLWRIETIDASWIGTSSIDSSRIGQINVRKSRKIKIK